MKTSSYLKKAKRELGWVGAGLKAFWVVAMKFRFSPSGKNLLISFWYDYRHYRRVCPEKTLKEFLDSRVLGLKIEASSRFRSAKSRQLNLTVADALAYNRIRFMFVQYLDSRSPRNYGPLATAIAGAWRKEDDDGGVAETELRGKSARNEVVEAIMQPVIKEQKEPIVQLVIEEHKDPIEQQQRVLNAKTYVIAVRLYLELAGKEEEFESLSWRLPDLKRFIREKFGVEKLPGRFEEFKGYSYKLILKDKNSAKKGQLRVPFRQISEHPELFGADVAKRARDILQKHF